MRQRIELTGTNSSIGLIALISNAHRSRQENNGAMLKIERPFAWIRDPRLRGDARFARTCFTFVLGRTGGFCGGPVPDPISNSAVKLPSADGTKSQDLEE